MDVGARRVLLVVVAAVLGMVALTAQDVTQFPLRPTASGSALPTTVNSVSTSSGAFTCDFSLGYICKITITSSTNPLVATLTNLPTNQFVHFVFDATGQALKALSWPAHVYCQQTGATPGSNDTWGLCSSISGALNAWTAASGINSSSAWSTGTDLYFSPDAGFFQSVFAAHGTFNTGQFGFANGGADQGKLTLYAGASLASNNAGGSNVAPTMAATDGTHCGASAVFDASTYPTTTRMDITMGTTNPTTVCPVTYGSLANCNIGSTCIASDASTFQALKCVGGTSGLTITAATDMHGDSVHVINICLQ